jgi:hypothetical protein
MKFYLAASALFFAGLLFNVHASAQHSSFAQRDSVADEICKSIQRLEKPDSTELYFTIFKHIATFAMRFPRELQPDEFLFVGLRLSRRCFDFRYYASKVSSENGDWKIEAELPKARADSKDCKALFEQKTFWYLETSGDTVNVTIADGFWTECFGDGTYSKLSIAPLSDCRFEASFIESDNHIRKNLSQPGEKYIYQVLERRNAYFLISSEIPGSRGCATTKLHFVRSKIDHDD